MSGRCARWKPKLAAGVTQMRLRGIECNSPTRYAEAFHVRKLII